MDLTRVTPQMVTEAASDCDRTAGEIAAQLASLKSYVMELQAMWHGVASNRFTELMALFDQHARHLNEALTGIAQGLRTNAVNYVTHEEVNVVNLNNISAGLPQARLN